MIVFDDAIAGRSAAFATPVAIIRADGPEEVGAAVAAMTAALDRGCHLAGFFSYELGYALEPRLVPRMPPYRRLPLLWFEVHAEGPRLGDDGWLAARRAYAGPVRWEWDEAAYRPRFDRVIEWIRAGDIYQANLSLRGRFRFTGDPRGLFRDLRRTAGAGHGAYVDTGAFQILSLSPELFFDLAADGAITTKPMKGTRPRGATVEADRALRDELAGSEKDRAENLMIVDLFRNDLSRLAAAPTVRTPRRFDVETYPTVHQMVSTVTARIAPRPGVARVLGTLFPSGSVTGAPKIRAMEIIAETEASPRGVYCGAIGWFAPDGAARFNVAIRTLTLFGAEGEIGVGGAVVADSRCADEYAECLLKARYFEQARRPISLIETLHGTRRAGLHLDRMEASAAWLGIPFNRAAAGRAIAGAGDGRVRLELAEDGTLALSTGALPPGASVWRFRIAEARIDSADPFIRHKTGWRAFYDDALRAAGCDEALFLNERGEICEGSRSTVFMVIGGAWLTPPLSCGLLDGRLRAEMLAAGRCTEAVLTPADLRRADAVWFGNSLRGLIRGEMVED